MRRAEDNLQAAKDKAKEVSSSAYQATKGKTHETYEAGRDTAQQAAEAAIEHALAALHAARDKVTTVKAMHFVTSPHCLVRVASVSLTALSFCQVQQQNVVFTTLIAVVTTYIC